MIGLYMACCANARLIMASVMLMYIIRSKHFFQKVGRFCRDCLLLDAINALTRLTSPECDARIKVRLGVSHSEVLWVARHTFGPLFLHCRCITEQHHRWWEAEPLPFYFHCPRMCMVVFFQRKCVCCRSRCKLPFRAAWTVMNNCRSQFGCQCAQSKKSAIRQVIESQV